MRIEELTYFLQIAESKSISDAAKKLFISQQGLSKALLGLEEQFHVTLFNRSSKSMVLTAEGKLFAESARKILNEYEKLCLQMTRLSANNTIQSGTEYVVYATPYILRYLLEDIYDIIRSQFPDIIFNFFEKSPKEIMVSLPTNTPNTICITDMPNCMLDDFKQKPDLTFSPIFQATLMAKVSAHSSWANKKYFFREELRELPLAIISDDMMIKILTLLLGENKLEKISIETLNRQIIDHKISSGEVVGFTDNFIESRQAKDNGFVAIPIVNSITMIVGFIYGNYNPPSNTALELAEVIRKNFPTT
ncbi:MAG TPA: LysR family transcriptional regulator [Syntrophomonadaceae bacterium]|nr:LysR family transcriptional regulator [Syntrophomonadaceae bacterium]